MAYDSTGTLRYEKDKAVVLVDFDIANLYRSLIPKYYNVQAQKYRPHVTVVRSRIDIVKNRDLWKKYEGKKINFSYSNVVNFDGTYFYLDAQSDQIGDIREELGLPRFRTNELGASRGCYHITIGNAKHTKRK